MDSSTKLTSPRSAPKLSPNTSERRCCVSFRREQRLTPTRVETGRDRMQLLSWSYLVFFAIVLLLYWTVSNVLYRKLLLIAATVVWFVFGIWWHALAAALMATTSYCTARWIASRPVERRGLPTLIGVSIPIVYFLFFRYLALWSGFDLRHPELLPWWAPNPLFGPIGLSFIMFETIAIQADLYFDRLERPGSFLDHMVFTLYFPTRVIGPLRRYQNFVDQVGARQQLTADCKGYLANRDRSAEEDRRRQSDRNLCPLQHAAR